MRNLMIAGIGFALICTGCQAATTAPAPPTNAETVMVKPGDTKSPLEKDGTAKSSFPPGVVLRLNAIMARSKNVIDQFDKVRGGVAQASKKGPADLTELNRLHEESKSAKSDLASEGKKLLESGQYYDNVIFSGMTMFAENVEKELDDEIKALNAPKK
jgi:hypothetical protein